MKVLNHVDLGKSFESLKKSIIDTEIELKAKNKTAETTFDRSCNYAYAYGTLIGAITGHIAGNTDTSYSFLSDALKEAENGVSEAPTLYLHEQVNLPDEIIETLDNTGAMAE